MRTTNPKFFLDKKASKIFGFKVYRVPRKHKKRLKISWGNQWRYFVKLKI